MSQIQIPEGSGTFYQSIQGENGKGTEVTILQTDSYYEGGDLKYEGHDHSSSEPTLSVFFSQEVTGFSLNIIDVDQRSDMEVGNYDDQIRVLAFDASGYPTPILFTTNANLDSNEAGHLVEHNGESGHLQIEGQNNTTADQSLINVSIPGPVSRVVMYYEDGNDDPNKFGHIFLDNMEIQNVLINDAPLAVDDFATVSDDVSNTFSVLGNDTDADGDNLTVTYVSSTDGSVYVNSDGTLSFVPPSDFSGTATVEYTISDGNGGTDAATLTVEVPCFTHGTMIRTALNKEVPIQNLSVGDMVETLDNGPKEILWIGSRIVPASGALAPVVFKQGAIGNYAELRVSQQHRMLLEDWRVEILFGTEEVLAPAFSLVNGGSIQIDEGGLIEYFHILLETHEILFANGSKTESLHLGAMNAAALKKFKLTEVGSIFPQLVDNIGLGAKTARPVLREYEVRTLLETPTFFKN
jgi:hypothetical protein